MSYLSFLTDVIDNTKESSLIFINVSSWYIKDAVEYGLINHICSRNKKIVYFEDSKENDGLLKNLNTLNGKFKEKNLIREDVVKRTLSEFIDLIEKHKKADYFLLSCPELQVWCDFSPLYTDHAEYYFDMDDEFFADLKRMADRFKKPFIIMINKEAIPSGLYFYRFDSAELIKTEYGKLSNSIDYLFFFHTGADYVEKNMTIVKAIKYDLRYNDFSLRNLCYDYRKKLLYEIPLTDEMNSLSGAMALGLNMDEASYFSRYWEFHKEELNEENKSEEESDPYSTSQFL